MKILVLNGGSSGLKASVRDAAAAAAALWDAQVDWGREPGFAEIRTKNAAGASQSSVIGRGRGEDSGADDRFLSSAQSGQTTKDDGLPHS